MIYIKNQINCLIVNKARAYVVPLSNRTWKLDFYSMKKNKNISFIVPDVSPYPDSFLRFDIDDNVFNLDEGLYKLNIYERDVVSKNDYLFSEQILRVIKLKNNINFDGEKEYVVYG